MLGAAPPRERAEGDLSSSLRALLGAGMSVRDAVRAVEVLQGAPHRPAYEAAIALAGTTVAAAEEAAAEE